MGERTLQGSLTFLGFAISILAVFYFAFEYLPRVSDWTRLAALVLLALFFAFLGVYIRDTVVGQPFFEGPRLRWLRPSVVLSLLALVAGIVAEIVFLAIDDVPRPVKILVSLLLGVGMIVVVARRRSQQALPAEAPPEPPPAPPPVVAVKPKPHARTKRPRSRAPRSR